MTLKYISVLQLTEFRDHKLVLSKRGAVDGGEYLTIPLDRCSFTLGCCSELTTLLRGTITAFLETVKEN